MTSTLSLNDYANNMFALEALPEIWIRSCTQYLRFLFKDSLRGQTVVDYGFGRGNWSLAFLRAGCKRVIAIDASADAVRRFSNYVEREGLEKNIEVMHVNFLESVPEIEFDLFWLYGVYQHLPHEERVSFLRKCAALAKRDNAQFYLYAYNAGCLREAVVNACRRFSIFDVQADYERVELLLTPQARLRARDDLTAPFIYWFSADEIAAHLEAGGWSAVRQDIPFDTFLQGEVSEEFYPFQLLSRRSSAASVVKEAELPYLLEIQDFKVLVTDLEKISWCSAEKQNIAAGMMNTFYTRESKIHAQDALIQIYLYVLRLLFQKQNENAHLYSPLANAYLELCRQSLWDIKPRQIPALLKPNLIVNHLSHYHIRF